ncbi:MAG: GDSL family lipase [Kiritimatiellaeota bacterium]|nr:GDSL family lipase [Kiritimatiellota bacterium]
MKTKSVPLTSRDLAWEGAVSIELGDGWVRPWRIFHREKRLYQADLRNRAGMTSGIRLTFRSPTETVRLSVRPSDELRTFDLLCDRDAAPPSTVKLLPGQTWAVWTGLPGRDKLIEIYLPARAAVVTGLELDADALVTAAADLRPRFVAYGSSITHCVGAHSPAQTWPALVARARNYHLTSLGFGGQCHLDTMIALQIKQMAVDFLVCSFGINVYGGNSLNNRTFQPAVVGFLRIVREAHPEIPIAVCSPIISPPRETVPNVAGMTLVKMREQIAEAVELLKEDGDDALHYFNGLDIFGKPELHLLPDDLHPNGDGYKKYAENFLRVVCDTIPGLP